MKKINFLVVFAVLLLFLLSLVGCSSYNKLEKTFTDKGYSVVETSPETEAIQSEGQVEVKPHVFYNLNTFTTIIVFEFTKPKQMKDFFEDSQTLQSILKNVDVNVDETQFYNALVENGYAKDNCLVISIGSDSENVRNVVKNL